jgi:hypothetical protein
MQIERLLKIALGLFQSLSERAQQCEPKSGRLKFSYPAGTHDDQL